MTAFTYNWDIGQYVYWIVYKPGCDYTNFEINLIFLIKLFLIWPKSQDKTLNILRMKRVFKVKQKGLSVDKNCLWTENVPLSVCILNLQFV